MNRTKTRLGRRLLRGLGWGTLGVAILTALHFPMAVDGPATPAPLIENADNFYEAAYSDRGEGASESKYVRVAQLAAHLEDVEPKIRQFVNEYRLQDARVLEVGAGSGTLQDVVADYTGLDIAASAARFFHKPFVHGSATELPFGASQFDACWTIWTLEHVPNPESALKEMRRVVRDGGYLYLYPAWNNPTWAPKGYPVRPFSDLSWPEKVEKSSLLLREMDWFKIWHRYPTRAIRLAKASLGDPTMLRYHKVEADFETYWMPDSDAVNSIDCFEAQLWFESRGDRVTNRRPASREIFSPCEPLIVQVRKPQGIPLASN